MVDLPIVLVLLGIAVAGVAVTVAVVAISGPATLTCRPGRSCGIPLRHRR
jgi:hypothetical protein